MRKLIFIISGFLIFISSSGFAEISISVNLFEGGQSLRFSRVDSSIVRSQEVRIRINSLEAAQYQVYQRVIEPFVNERGERLDMQALTSKTLLGSNSQGALYHTEEMSLSYGDELLYTSDTQGNSDSFRIIYTVRGNKLNASGSFLGKILYTVRQIAGREEKTYILNVYIDASEEFNIEANTSSGRDIVKLNTKSKQEMEGYLRISFKGNLNKEVKLYQVLEDLPQNELRETIDKEVIKFSVSANDESKVSYRSPTGLEKKQVLLYSSNQPEDNVYVRFFLDEEKIKSQKAGSYKSKLIYILERDGEERSFYLNLEVDVQPIFTLETILPPEGMYFTNLLPTSPPQVKEVEVIVKTNLGKPYMVIQTINNPLTNEEGKEIPCNYLTMRQEIIEGSPYKVQFSEFTSLPLGDTPLIISNDKGEPIRFKVTYRLKPYSGMFAGNYSTRVNYSLAER
ncbi:MAG: hypothetical protein NC820_06640 [Candidatus Omnitrophica bacterium]|nr:hypothetical protein [Candidatus Omnitrophota bacterium]